MPITAGQKGRATDFINKSERNATPSTDAGRVPKLEADGQLSKAFISASFGGTGSDGALAVASGTTTINLGGVAIFVKNYTSISITGTGKVDFSNPHDNGTVIILKSQGDVTLTSSQTPMLDGRLLGGKGAVSQTATTDTVKNGLSGSAGYPPNMFSSSPGTGGTYGSPGGAGGIGTFSTSLTRFPTASALMQMLAAKYPYIFMGSGGGAGAASAFTNGNAVTGKGGRAAGSMVIECGGAWNFTTTGGINFTGEVGGNGSGTSTRKKSGGGGGGAAGYFLALVKSIIANTGTILTTGGGGGAGSIDMRGGAYSQTVGGGGGGTSYQSGTAGSVDYYSPTGGVGANGLSLVGLNTEIA